MNSQLGDFFKTTVGVCQGCFLSPILFDLFPEKIMQETLHDYHMSSSISGRPICNLQFADNVNLMGSSNGKLQVLANRLIETATAYRMEVSTENSKTMTNSMNNISAGTRMNGQKLEEVISFKYLGETLCIDGTCSIEVQIRIASAMAAKARLKRIWWCSTINLASKFNLYKSLVTSSLL